MHSDSLIDFILHYLDFNEHIELLRWLPEIPRWVNKVLPITGTPYLKYPGTSASMVESKDTPENTEMDTDNTEPAAEGGIQTEYPSD